MMTPQHANFLLAYLYKNRLFTSLHYNQPDMPAEVILYDMRNGFVFIIYICQLNEDVIFFIELFDSVMSRFEINEH